MGQIPDRPRKGHHAITSTRGPAGRPRHTFAVRSGTQGKRRRRVGWSRPWAPGRGGLGLPWHARNDLPAGPVENGAESRMEVIVEPKCRVTSKLDAETMSVLPLIRTGKKH